MDWSDEAPSRTLGAGGLCLFLSHSVKGRPAHLQWLAPCFDPCYAVLAPRGVVGPRKQDWRVAPSFLYQLWLT